MTKTEKRIQIMLSAEKLFTSKRFHEITLDDVARDAKVGKGTIYLYFQSKEDLFFQTATSGFEELCALLSNGSSHEGSFESRLLCACGQIGDFFDSRKQLFRMMQDEDARLCFSKGNFRDRWFEKRKALRQILTRLISEGVATKQIRNDVEPEILADILLGMIRTRAYELEAAPAHMRETRLLIDLFCNGAKV